jgi:hypothetical protein
MFDPRDPYERYCWHYDAKWPLSIAQIIANQSVDPPTVALIWFLLDYGASLIIAGPTDPQPGVGKTTTINALLQFLSENITLVYTCGMYESFSFLATPGLDPATTCIVSNEISDHSPIYMWGHVAQRYLKLPMHGYRIITSLHADTIDDVQRMLTSDLCLSADGVSHLGIVINIGLVGEEHRRCWATTYFFHPSRELYHPHAAVTLHLSSWKEEDDAFQHADQHTLDELAYWAGIPVQTLAATLEQRTSCLIEAAKDGGADMHRMRTIIKEMQAPIATTRY